MLQALQTVNVDILMARDRTSTLLGYSLGFTIAHIAAFIVGLHWGIIGVAVAYAISSTFVEPVLTYLMARALGVSPFTTLRAVLGVGRAALVMTGAVLLTGSLSSTRTRPRHSGSDCASRSVASCSPDWRLAGPRGRARCALARAPLAARRDGPRAAVPSQA